MSQKLEVRFSSRLQAIDALHSWYTCPKDKKIVQPFRVQENKTWGSYWTLACAHRFKSLRELEKVDAVEGGHNAEVFLTFETRDRDGTQSGHMTQWGRSFLLQYYQMLSNLMGYKIGITPSNGATQAKDTTNTLRTFQLGSSGNAYQTLACMDASGSGTYGMQVGTSATANTATQDLLNTLIANGAGAGQLSYGSMGMTQPAGSAPCSYTFTRTLTNNSGGDITINEAGLVLAGNDSGSAQRNYMIIRDVTGAVTVVNTANTTGTYTLSYTIA